MSHPTAAFARFALHAYFRQCDASAAFHEKRMDAFARSIEVWGLLFICPMLRCRRMGGYAACRILVQKRCDAMLRGALVGISSIPCSRA